MVEQARKRFEVVIRQGSPRGDLYELEQTTYYQVVDTLSQRVIMVFESQMEATLSRDTGMWDDYSFTGVSDVTIAPDERSVLVRYVGGQQAAFPLAQEAEGADPDITS